MEELEKKRDLLSTAVRFTAVLVVLLMAAFFSVTVKNMATISDQVEEMKDGPFPTSVAAGHIETDVAQVETLAMHVTHFRDTPDNITELRQHFDEINSNMRKQLTAVNPDSLVNPTEAYILRAKYNTLYVRILNLLEMVQDQTTPSSIIEDYVNASIMPLANDILVLANDILNETTDKVDATHTIVTQACSQTIWFACILIIFVVLMVCLYAAMLRRKNRQEEQLRQHLESALALAQSANAAKSDFLSNMSHDIRTPMNAIVGLTTIANDNIDDPLRVKQCLTRIMTSSKHLLSLINDVLDMNKIESGKTILSEERFNLPSLVEELITIMQPQATAKHLDTDVVINNIHHEELIGDAMRLRQILLNLLSNAVKYTNDGDTVRVIMTEDTPTREGYANLQFMVEDTGIGMESDFLTRIFEPFERESNDFTIFTEGTGLGMAITKNLVDLMGGCITVKSELGHGTKFTVCLPFKVPTALPDLDATGFDALRILVVDDNYLVMQNAIHTLTEFGVQAVGSTTIEDAIELVMTAQRAGEPYDMVIVDLAMPNIDEAETVRRIHEAAGDAVPIVVVASYFVEDSARVARIEGVSAAITKPLFRSRLHETVRRLCIDDDPIPQPAAKLHTPISGRVLLVDDNEINLEIGMKLIAKFGPEAEGVNGGLEAIAKIGDAPDGYYDLVFMDCKMPHMDGFETTKAIRRFIKERGRSHLPIVAMTANAFDEDREHAYEAGMDGFMSKPINMEELENNLRTYLS